MIDVTIILHSEANRNIKYKITCNIIRIIFTLTGDSGIFDYSTTLIYASSTVSQYMNIFYNDTVARSIAGSFININIKNQNINLAFSPHNYQERNVRHLRTYSPKRYQDRRNLNY